jgi:hypothetical protein
MWFNTSGSDGVTDVHLEFLLILAKAQRCITLKNFIHENTESPYICLRSIYVVDESFRAHIDRTADVDVLPALPNVI